MEAVTVLAPAKLNLTLGVTGFAENGYHTLDMLMQAVSLYEKVEVRKSAGLAAFVARLARACRRPQHCGESRAGLFP